jgi:hypothetical protein
VFTDHVAAQVRQASDVRTAYVALDAVAAGAGTLALAHRPASTLPLVCAVTHPLAGVHDVLALRAHTTATASRLVNQLIERIDHPGSQTALGPGVESEELSPLRAASKTA